MQDTLLLLSPERAAERLDIGRTLLYELLASGEIESVKLGRNRRIPAEALAAYVDRLRARHRTPDTPELSPAGEGPRWPDRGRPAPSRDRRPVRQRGET
jgi:excisionase family DNA binding protein